MKKIKVTLDKKYGAYTVELNDGNKKDVVFECNTCDEFTKFLQGRPNAPKYVVASHDIVKLLKRK